MDGRWSCLELQPAVVPTSRGDLHHLDVVVDGASMQVVSGRAGVTILNRTWLGDRPSPPDVFLGRAVDRVAGAGRLPLLACQECADLECGVLTAALDVGEHEVTWSDYRWVTGYDDDGVPEVPQSPMRFERGAYERELDQAVVVLQSLPREVRRPPRWWWRRR